MQQLHRKKPPTSSQYRVCQRCHHTKPIMEFVYYWDYTRTCIDCHNEQKRYYRSLESTRLKHRAYKRRRRATCATYNQQNAEQNIRYANRIKQQTPIWADKQAIARLKREVKKINELTKVLNILSNKSTVYCVEHIVPLVAMDLVDGLWTQVASGLHAITNVRITTKEEASRKWNRLENNNE